jgi:hypothetical protein
VPGLGDAAVEHAGAPPLPAPDPVVAVPLGEELGVVSVSPPQAKTDATKRGNHE